MRKKEKSQDYVNTAFQRHYATHPPIETHYGKSTLKGTGYGVLTGGLLGAGLGALGSGKGHRLQGALEGLAAGGAGGAGIGAFGGLIGEASRVSHQEIKNQNATENHLLANDPKYVRHRNLLDKVDDDIYDHKWKFGKIQEEEEHQALLDRLEELEQNHQDWTSRYDDLMDRYDNNYNNRYW